MPKSIRDPEAKQRLVDAASALVAAHGLRGATIRDIASAAGVSTGSVMHYFADKPVLMAAVLDDTNQRAGARVMRAVGQRRGLDGLRAAAEALLPVDAERRRTWKVWTAFWMESDSLHEATVGLSLGHDVLRSMFKASLRQAVDDGALPEDLDIDHEAQHLAVLLAGLGLLGGVEGASRVRGVARRLLDEHFADLANRHARRQLVG